MKSIKFRFHTVALLSLALPVAAFAQATGSSDDKPTTTPTTRPSTGTAGATDPTTSTPGTATGKLADPVALFRQLDTDGNGQLSREEFARISTALGTDRNTPSATNPSASTPDTTRPGTSSPGTSGSGTRPNQR